MRYTLSLLGVVFLFPHLQAQTPSPLRLVPDQADLFIEIQQPRLLLEAVTTLDIVEKIQEFPQVQELMDSTQARRFYQLLGHYERELGARWPELVDNLAGGGIVVAVKLGKQPAPSLLVMQGKDAELTGKFFKITLEIIEQELARQESKQRPVHGEYQGIKTVKIGNEFHAAVAGSALLVSNNEQALQAGLDLHLGKKTASLDKTDTPAKLEKLLSRDTLARVWLNMETVRKSPQAAEIYKTPRQPVLTVLFGEYVDLLGRTPFVCAGVTRENKGLTTSIRMPVGREGMGADAALHLPPENMPGSRPLLQPKGVLYSDSFYLDLGQIWENRVELFGEEAAKAIEQADQQTGRIPFVKVQLSKLLTEVGAYHRIVVAHQPRVGYTRQPNQPIPAFAFITEMRKPDEFARSMEGILRGAGLLASNQVKLKLVEEDYNRTKIVGYRFSETADLPQDVNNLRFNFSPCFVRVGNQFVFCSTIEFARELVDLLQEEATSKNAGSPATTRSWIYTSGLAEILKSVEDQLVTQAVLDQAIPAEEARKQVQGFLKLLSTAGAVRLEATVGAKEFRYDLSYQP